MSHTSEVKNININKTHENALKRAAEKVGGQFLGWGEHKLYSSKETGFGIKLKNWRYPIVINGTTIKMDNYNGSWGKQSELDGFNTRLRTEIAAEAYRKQGHVVTERVISDTKIELFVNVGE